MQYTIDELKDKVFENVLDVYGIFKAHFGEDKVDLQNVPSNLEFASLLGSIAYDANTLKYDAGQDDIDFLRRVQDYKKFAVYVWFPTVIVTNENGRSIVIWDLYVQVEIDIYGHIPYENWGMLWNRSRYDTAQFLCNYMHSHVCDIPKFDFTAFQKPCLGTASIKDTIVTLKSDNDPAMWMLFCEELARAVTVESLDGHPYNYLESVGKYNALAEYGNFSRAAHDLYQTLRYTNANFTRETSSYWLRSEQLAVMLRDFTTYYLKHGHFSFCYRYGRFGIGMSFYDYMVDISNAFVSYYNQYLKEGTGKIQFVYDTGFLIKVMVVDRKFHAPGSVDENRANFGRYVGMHILTFKGRNVTLEIVDNVAGSSVPVLTTLLNKNVAMYVLEQILQILNFRFNGESTSNGLGAAEATAKPRKTVCYI